jgi:hypothetical protein
MEPAPRIDSPRLDYKTVGGIQKSSQEGHVIYRQDVILDNKRLTFTIHFDKEISSEDANNAMQASIKKAANLVKTLELGSKGLHAIGISPERGIVGAWHDEKGITQGTVKERLFNEFTQSINKDDKDKIQAKLLSIYTDRLINEFDEFIPTSIVPINVEITSFSDVDLTSMPKDVQETYKLFYKNAAEATENADKLESLEISKQKALLKSVSEAYGKMDNLPVIGYEKKLELLNIKMGLEQTSLDLKKAVDAEAAKTFSNLENQLVSMANCYNDIVAQRKRLERDPQGNQTASIASLTAIEEEMRIKIKDVNSLMSQRALTTNEIAIAKTKVMSFQAVVEKKYALIDEQMRLEGSKKLSQEDKNRLEQIKTELLQAPPSEFMKATQGQIEDRLKGPVRNMISPSEMKKLYDIYPELKWGIESLDKKSYLDFALLTPANWINIQNAVIKESSAGYMHVACIKSEPLNINLKGGVPANLRSAPFFDQRAANLIKTTSYLKNSDGSIYNQMVSFRGGQFPTKAAAKEALLEILKTVPQNSNMPIELHVNALLTPTQLTMIKNDKGLLETHKKSVEEALKDPALAGKFRIAFTNAGVNEGAVNQPINKKVAIPMQMGWHTSIKEYSNAGIEQVNRILNEKLAIIEGFNATVNSVDRQDLASNLDVLGAVVQVGLMLEEIWAQNSFADAAVGDNQFKMPALWKVIDYMLGITDYINCMSGKDRTGKVEANAQEIFDEIGMNIADHKRELTDRFNEINNRIPIGLQKVWESQRNILTAACFSVNELEQCYEGFKAIDPSNNAYFELDSIVKKKIDEKIKIAKLGLGSKLLETKKIGESFYGFTLPIQILPGTVAISTNDPKNATAEGIKAKEAFPIAISNMLDPKTGNQEALANKQREAYNRRLSETTSLEVTRINTSVPGFKIEGGEPLARYSSGFYREYVMWELAKHDRTVIKERFPSWVGLEDLDRNEADEFFNQILAIKDNEQSLRAKQPAWNDILMKIEVAKQQTLFPQTKVKA